MCVRALRVGGVITSTPVHTHTQQALDLTGHGHGSVVSQSVTLCGRRQKCLAQELAKQNTAQDTLFRRQPSSLDADA